MNRRELSDLVELNDPAWPMILEWIKSARNPVQILPHEKADGERVLLQLQVTTRSPMGALAYESSGLLIDNGWIRFLGSGAANEVLSLLAWNNLAEKAIEPHLRGAFVIAYDVVGGFFAINGGKFEGKTGSVFYLAPDTRQWEDTQKSYSDLLYWAIQGDLERYYSNARWIGWQNEIAPIALDQGISFYPPLWAQGPEVSERAKRAISIFELWGLHNQYSK